MTGYSKFPATYSTIIFGLHVSLHDNDHHKILAQQIRPSVQLIVLPLGCCMTWFAACLSRFPLPYLPVLVMWVNIAKEVVVSCTLFGMLAVWYTVMASLGKSKGGGRIIVPKWACPPPTVHWCAGTHSSCFHATFSLNCISIS